ncbi:hypothetical protein FB451DRAFT_1168454 [Mycena latifolia]|nr:hypothetical protein FB451DRAFT_1168454 [Mycena latifolia]
MASDSDPDPLIVRRELCQICSSRMGALRPYSGLSDPTKVAYRGRMVQTCSGPGSHWTVSHTNISYLFEDAEALINRFNWQVTAGELPMPATFLRPLRRATPVAPALAPVNDGAGISAYSDAVDSHLPRNACPKHHVAASPALPQPVPAPHLTHAPAPTARVPGPVVPQPATVHRAPHAPPTRRLDLKAKQLAMDERQKRTVELVIYYLLSSLPVDYWNSSWKIVDMDTILTVEKGRVTLLKIRPSLLQELTLQECPGLPDQLSRQPRVVGTKRGAAAATTVIDVDAVAPNLLSSTAPAQTIPADTVIIPAAPGHTTHPPHSHSNLPVVKKAKSTKREEREWIVDCPLSRWEAGWDKISRRLDRKKGKANKITKLRNSPRFLGTTTGNRRLASTKPYSEPFLRI